MEAFIFDAVRSPRGKARPDGPLAGLEPAAMVAQLAQALDQRVEEIGRASCRERV